MRIILKLQKIQLWFVPIKKYALCGKKIKLPPLRCALQRAQRYTEDSVASISIEKSYTFRSTQKTLCFSVISSECSERVVNFLCRELRIFTHTLQMGQAIASFQNMAFKSSLIIRYLPKNYARKIREFLAGKGNIQKNKNIIQKKYLFFLQSNRNKYPFSRFSLLFP